MLRRANLLAVICLLIVAGCDGCTRNTAELEQRAIASTEESVLMRLNRIAEADVPESQEARWLADTWRDRPKAENYELTEPVLLAWAEHHPEEAEAIERTLRTWRNRLEAYGR